MEFPEDTPSPPTEATSLSRRCKNAWIGSTVGQHCPVVCLPAPAPVGAGEAIPDLGEADYQPLGSPEASVRICRDRPRW